MGRREEGPSHADSGGFRTSAMDPRCPLTKVNAGTEVGGGWAECFLCALGPHLQPRDCGWSERALWPSPWAGWAWSLSLWVSYPPVSCPVFPTAPPRRLGGSVKFICSVTLVRTCLRPRLKMKEMKTERPVLARGTQTKRAESIFKSRVLGSLNTELWPFLSFSGLLFF